MADGLLSNIFGAIDSAKRGVSNRYNMLMDNPREYLAQIEERAKESNRVQQAGIPGLLAQYTGAPITPEQQRAAEYANQQMQDVALGFTGNIKPTSGLLGNQFNILKRDASDIFGSGAEKIRYIDPKSGGSIEVLARPNYPASVVNLEVPEAFRGKKIGESLQAQVLQDFPSMQGQVSSKAAAKTAYRLGRRPADNPNASLDDVFKAIDENSSVNMVSPQMQKQGGLLGTEAAPAKTKNAFEKPLTEKQFYNQYAQHIDLQARNKNNSQENIKGIIETGFKKTFNVNAVPPYRGGQPKDVTSKIFGPKTGDTVYLAPKNAWEDSRNGMKIKEGWKPRGWEIINVNKDYPNMYELYLDSFKKYNNSN